MHLEQLVPLQALVKFESAVGCSWTFVSVIMVVCECIEAIHLLSLGLGGYWALSCSILLVFLQASPCKPRQVRLSSYSISHNTLTATGGASASESRVRFRVPVGSREISHLPLSCGAHGP